MIDLYTWTTPNGRKVSIMLEECGLAYEVHPINIGKRAQFEPEFVAINPNSKIPAIVDREAEGGSLSVFESGAVLIYLAEKSGKFLAPKGRQRASVLEWLMWQMGGIGPMFGQAFHFRNLSEKIPYAIERYVNESARLVRVLDARLAEAEFMGGDYSIADMATYPWVAVTFGMLVKVKPELVEQGQHVQRWLDTMGARPGVQRGMTVPKV